MIHYIFAKALLNLFRPINTQQSGCAHDVGLGSHARVAAVQAIASHRPQDMRAVGFFQDGIVRALGRQHLLGRIVDDAQSIGVVVLGRRFPVPLDARGAVLVAEGRVREVETIVHHTGDDALAGEGLKPPSGSPQRRER